MAGRKLSCTALVQGSVVNVLLGKIFLQQQIEMREQSSFFGKGSALVREQCSDCTGFHQEGC